MVFPGMAGGLAAGAGDPSFRSDASSGIVHSNEPHALSSAWLVRAHRSVRWFRATHRPARYSDEFVFSGAIIAQQRASSLFRQFVKKSVLASGLARTMSKRSTMA